MKKKYTKKNTVPVKVAGVPLRAKPEQVQSFNQALDELHAAVAHLWRTIHEALRLV